MNDKSPIIPPSIYASATPKQATITHIPKKGPSPPFPDVPISNCQQQNHTSPHHQNNTFNIKTDQNNLLTRRRARVVMKKTMKPSKFLFLVSILDSL